MFHVKHKKKDTHIN